MQKYITLSSLILYCCLLFSCKVPTRTIVKPIVAVTIAPLAYLVDQIADTTVDIDIIVPETTSAETYEMSARQMMSISDSDIIFAIGLIDFEQVLSNKINSLSAISKFINLSDGISLQDNECTHTHHIESEHNHTHLYDPHIWLSPKMMKLIARKISDLLIKNIPTNKELYQKNTIKLLNNINILDTTLSEIFSKCNNKTFAIVHPSLSYFANDYNLNQIAIENQGKEPSVMRLMELIDSIRILNIRAILYDKQNNNQTAQQISKELAIDMIEYDPLERDWLKNMEYLGNFLCN